MVRRSIPPSSTRLLSLALQGGGAHGAFTWGVLDRLLQDESIVIDAVSGTSSGAMNACALAQGWASGGARGARESLDEFWNALSATQALASWWQATVHSMAPLNHWLASTLPLSFNPLRRLVEDFFNPDVIAGSPVQVFLAATRVCDGQLAVFSPDRITHDAILASACIPHWFPAVDIDGEAYWDGGYAGNPTLEPLIARGFSEELLCVLLQPPIRLAPENQRDAIAERAFQLGFSAAFGRELRDLRLAQAHLRGRWWLRSQERRLANLTVATIAPDRELTANQGHAATDSRITHLAKLHEMGTHCASDWLRHEGHAAQPVSMN